ncbi:MAG: TlpA family protein disulfide reductase [Planctomycetota bacterium]|jgi:thiol-disulfide isomerase/thioredoxin
MVYRFLLVVLALALLVGCNPPIDPAEDAGARVTVEVFWVSWCGYCEQQLAIVQEIHEEIQGKYIGDVVEFIGVNVGDDIQTVAPLVKERGYTFLIKTGGHPPPVLAYPATVIRVAGQDTPAAQWVGLVSKAGMYKVIIEVVNQL